MFFTVLPFFYHLQDVSAAEFLHIASFKSVFLIWLDFLPFTLLSRSYSSVLCVYLQFDNFKRVFKVVEELKGPLVENIRQHFLLSDKLAR